MCLRGLSCPAAAQWLVSRPRGKVQLQEREREREEVKIDEQVFEQEGV